MDDRIKELKADIQHEMASLKKLLKEMEGISLLEIFMVMNYSATGWND